MSSLSTRKCENAPSNASWKYSVKRPITSRSQPKNDTKTSSGRGSSDCATNPPMITARYSRSAYGVSFRTTFRLSIGNSPLSKKYNSGFRRPLSRKVLNRPCFPDNRRQRGRCHRSGEMIPKKGPETFSTVCKQTGFQTDGGRDRRAQRLVFARCTTASGVSDADE